VSDGARVVDFSIHKVVRSADADKIANLARHPKSLGTAVCFSRLNRLELTEVRTSELWLFGAFN